MRGPHEVEESRIDRFSGAVWHLKHEYRGFFYLDQSEHARYDPLLWSYADLRSLCKAVKVKGSGKRAELVKRLQEWNRLRLNKGVAGLAALQGKGSPNEMKKVAIHECGGKLRFLLSQNIVPRTSSPQHNEASRQIGEQNEAPNFTSPRLHGGKKLLSTTTGKKSRSEKINEKKQPVSSQKRRTSLLGGAKFENRETVAVSPTLLKPLNIIAGESKGVDVTPGKSILKNNSSILAPHDENGSASRISFSPFNGTKVIPHIDAHLKQQESPFGKKRTMK